MPFAVDRAVSHPVGWHRGWDVRHAGDFHGQSPTAWTVGSSGDPRLSDTGVHRLALPPPRYTLREPPQTPDLGVHFARIPPLHTVSSGEDDGDDADGQIRVPRNTQGSVVVRRGLRRRPSTPTSPTRTRSSPCTRGSLRTALTKPELCLYTRSTLRIRKCTGTPPAPRVCMCPPSVFA